MRTTQQLSITLPKAMAELVRERVDAGEYASESEVIRDALRSLQARDRALEHWLQTEVVAAYNEVRADPASRVSSDEVRARLSALHERTTQEQS